MGNCDKIIVSTTDLRPSLYSILQGLEEAGLLDKVITTIAFAPSGLMNKILKKGERFLPQAILKGIDRRTVPPFLSGKVERLMCREAIRLLTRYLTGDLISHKVWRWAEVGFDSEVACRYGGFRGCVYGMEHSSLETFKRQKDAGGLNVLRQVMAHGRFAYAVMKRQAEIFPNYATLYTKVMLGDMERTLSRKEKEYELADLIVANSNFARETFLAEGTDPAKVIAIPTGCPLPLQRIAKKSSVNSPLVFLFAGTLSLRKGLPYLIEAWKMLDAKRAAELWLVGKSEIKNIRALLSEGDNIRYIHPVSKKALGEIYDKADVLVLPTLLEGLAHVILEGISHGMPVITTPASGCGNFVESGLNGFIVKTEDAESLYDAMRQCLMQRDRLFMMGEHSLKKAQQWTIADSNRAHFDKINKFFQLHKGEIK